MIVYRIFQCEILFLFLLQIQLGPSEFLTGVSGTIGPFKSLINVITSLTFVTNTRSYGPFGKGRGTQFHIQMQIMVGLLVSLVVPTNISMRLVSTQTKM